MADFRFERNTEGFRSVLTSDEVVALLTAKARRVSARAPGSRVRRVNDAPGHGDTLPRARVRVYGDLQREADTGYLSRALGGG